MLGYLFKGAIGTDWLRYTVVERWHDNFAIYLFALPNMTYGIMDII